MKTEKKVRVPRAKSRAARIRKLYEQGKMTPKQIAEKVGVPVSYVYVIRSKMKAEGGGLPAVLAKSPMPVPGGIQEIAVRVEEAQPYQHIYIPNTRVSPALRPAHVVIERPPLWERIKERIRSWFA